MRALAYRFSRSPAEALSAAESAYQTARAVFRDSPDHPRTIEGRHVYGLALGAAGEHVRGIEQLAQSVAEAAATFGPSSRMVGVYSLSLAELQLESGLVVDALENSSRAVGIIAQHTNPESFRFANALHLRGLALLAAGRIDNALSDLTRAADTLRRTLPDGHEIARRFRADHALALAVAGSHRQAQDLLEALIPEPGSAARSGGKQRVVHDRGRETPRRRARRGAPLSTTGIAVGGDGSPRRAPADEGSHRARSGSAGSFEDRRGGRIVQASVDALAAPAKQYGAGAPRHSPGPRRRERRDRAPTPDRVASIVMLRD